MEKRKRIFTPEYKAAQKLRCEKYKSSEKYIAKKNSLEFKAKAKAYRELPSSIAAAKLRNQTPEAKAKQKARNELQEVKDYKSEHAKKPTSKLKRKLWSRTDKAKLAKKKYTNNYKNTETYKIATQKRRETIERKEYLKNYLKTPKGTAIRISINENRRAIKNAATIGDLKEIQNWIAEWKAHQSVYCHWCKDNFNPYQCHVDHVTPLSKGGKHCLTNLVISCAKCNLSKGSKMPDVWLATR